MKVSGIFKTLIVVVACIIVGALVLNYLLPNTVSLMCNFVEDAIYNGTGLKFDLNGDDKIGTGNTSGDYSKNSIANDNKNNNGTDNTKVNGFTSSGD
jgi:hypothetical protein